MSKFLALALLLCLVGGSLATNVYVGVYYSPSCAAESMIEEISLPATSACTQDTLYTNEYNLLTSGYSFSYGCGSGCSGSCDESALDISSGDCV